MLRHSSAKQKAQAVTLGILGLQAEVDVKVTTGLNGRNWVPAHVALQDHMAATTLLYGTLL